MFPDRKTAEGTAGKGLSAMNIQVDKRINGSPKEFVAEFEQLIANDLQEGRRIILESLDATVEWGDVQS
jgi:hypothetical protein